MGVYKSGVYGSGVYKSGVYKSGSEDTVTIGGRTYKTVKIGDQVWMAENLDYKFTGLTVGSWSTDPSAGYYNNNEGTYGIDGRRRCGLLYNWYAVKYLEDHKSELLPSGWHVPTDAEWTALIGAVGDDAGTKLKAVDNSVDSGTWPTGWDGTDDYGFGVLPAGTYREGFAALGVYGNFWSSSENSSSYAWYYYFVSRSSVARNSQDKTRGFSIRLVKDAPAALLGGPLLGSSNTEATDGE